MEKIFISYSHANSSATNSNFDFFNLSIMYKIMLRKLAVDYK